MGRKHRSSSMGSAPPTTPAPPQATSLPSSKHTKLDLAAANKLVDHFVHCSNSHSEENGGNDGRTPFHCVVGAASSILGSEETKLDGLFLTEALCTRMKELDAAMLTSATSTLASTSKHSKAGGNQQQQSHLHKLMLAPDTESGYTPLHIAVLNRDLITLMILLGHASSSLDSTVGNNHIQQQQQFQMLHPLRLLDGNLDTMGRGEADENQFDTLNALAESVDYENLTPLQLLGKTSAGGLEKCRRTLTWKSLRKLWKNQPCSEHGMKEGGLNVQGRNGIDRNTSSGGNGDENNTPRRYRRRMISFGDDRDYDSLNYDIEHTDVDENQRREGRARSSSFNVDLDAGNHDDDDEEEERNNAGANDLRPLEDDADFNLLADNNDDDNHSSNQEPPTQQLQRTRSDSIKQHQTHTATEDDFGCEVLTFGRADHCALGVPQFATSGRATTKQGAADNVFSLSSSNSSYKPKRVETFALGDLRREWGSGNQERENQSVDSPAVSIATASHHTLVSTRSGQLYSFGYGKGGRLGTGDENHRPLPTRVLGPLSKRIVASIAAAENHSLCSTNDGRVYAWGSNGFGQLGYSSSRDSSSGQDEVNNSRLSPRRVEGELKQSFVVAVAAGDRHSVALTKLGEVYCWGDNRSGQLARFSSSLTSSAGVASSPSSQANNRCCPRPQRVEGLWSAQPRRRAIAIAAAEFSTLVLTMPPVVSTGESSLASLPVNTVYGWGHGNHSVMRVVFPSVASNANASIYSRSICINPTAIACAKYHNVAATADGRVYTWGLHSESLGIEKSPASERKNSESDWATATEFRRPRSNSQSGSNSSSVTASSSISSPQLVAGMLPENGGGKAVAVSASESHTAIVTADGHLFTWGAVDRNDVLGHKGVKWQPSPRKVKRVHRAVSVAAAKEHTALLMATSFPALPNCYSGNAVCHNDVEPLSLQDHAAIEISRNVDMFNVVPVALVAHRLNCRPLMNYCDEFIHRNLDGVLAVGNKNDFTSFLGSKRSCVVGETRISCDCDGSFHPFLYKLANTNGWVDDAKILLDKYSGAIIIRQSVKKKDRRKSKREERQQLVASTTQEKQEQDAVDASTTRKQIAEEKQVKSNIEESCSPAVESEDQLKHQVPRKLFHDMAAASRSKASSANSATSKYHCTVCNVSCPDNDSYTLHMNGRKHRNRLSHARAEEEKKVAESMMAMKQMQLMEKSTISKPLLETKACISKSAWGLSANTSVPNKAITATDVTPNKTSLAPHPASKPKTRDRSKSFLEILNEEQQRLSLNAQHGNFLTPPATKEPPISRKTIAGATRSSKAFTPVAYGMKVPGPPISSPGSSLPLSAFMKKSGEQKQRANSVSSIGASWGAKPSATSGVGVSWGGVRPSSSKAAMSPTLEAPSSKMKSFSQIQQEEEAFRSNEDHMCQIDGNQWFVQQRERAASIGEIQEQEAKDREMQDMIEEQKQIEKEIMKKVKQEKKKKKRDDAKKKQQQNGKKQEQQGRQNKNKKEKKQPKEQKGGGDGNAKRRKNQNTAVSR